MVAAETLLREILYCVRRWYMCTKLHGVTSQKKAVDMGTAAIGINWLYINYQLDALIIIYS